MANTTQRFKYTLPNTGDKDWGNSINGNFINIDLNLGAIHDKSQSIENKLGSMNYISFRTNQNFIKLSTSTYQENYLYIGTVENNTFIGQQVSITEIDDYTGFYIYADYDYPSSGSYTPPYTENWRTGEILVKISKISDRDSSIEYAYTHFPQSLGGFYIPDGNYDFSQNIVFKKVTPLIAPETYTLQIPTRFGKAIIDNRKIVTSGIIDTDFDLSDFIDSDTLPDVEVGFLLWNSATKKAQNIYIDWAFEFINSMWKIIIYPDVQPAELENCWIRIIKYSNI